MTPDVPCIPLRVHSHHSLLRSSLRVEEACERAREWGLPALALTDDGNLFGAVAFCRAAEKAGLRPILGCDLHVASDGAGQHRLVVLCENAAGYASLTRLVSLSSTEGLTDGVPVVSRPLLARYAAGLLAISPGRDGEIGALLAAGRSAEAQRAASDLREAFGAGNAFVGLQDHGEDGARELNDGLARLAAASGLRTVACADVRFLDAEDLDAYRALHCIGAGLTLDDPAAAIGRPGQRLPSPEDMARRFAAHPDAIAATAEIAERCRFTLPEHADPLLPDFDVPAGETIVSFLRRTAQEGLRARLEEIRRLGGEACRIPEAEYEARLELELEVICRTGFPGYFLIVWDLFRFARESNIPVGPGRGSSAGSLVAWCLRITDMDPLRWGLLFERFLNPGRKSLPDIDMDFCQRRRGELIRYVQNKYGADHVCQIITFGALNAKSVIRDVGRVLNMTYGEVDRIARMVPADPKMTIEKALAESSQLADLRESDPRVRRLLEIAQSLEGLHRNAGVHAAGVIIAPRPLVELTPVFRTGRDEITTQFDMNGVEAVGLVKMDFLGLKTLTVIDDAVKSIARSEGRTIRIEELPLDDDATFQLFREARTSGVFQFESSGMRDILRRLAPRELEDLIALNALYRPGPMQHIDSFIARRRGREKVTYPHPLLESALASTHGIMVYQEQVMIASQQLAGFTQAEADDLRKAMGKKNAEVMGLQKDKFVAGAVKNKVPETVAADIFEAIREFAGYAFNRSHSACYALVAYWCGWLKANHPAHFMAAQLTSDRDTTDKIVRYIAECREMAIEVLPPDVNESEEDFAVLSPTTIRFGLSAIKGVGHGAVASILEARARVGRFESLQQFCSEIDLRLNNKKVLEALIKAGALDALGAERSSLMFALDATLDAAARIRADREAGQASLFGGPDPAAVEAAPALPPMPPWPRRDRLRHEKEVLGFYVSGHPVEEHAEMLTTLGVTPLGDLAEMAGKEARVAGTVAGLRKIRTRKGDWMAFVQLEDLTGSIEVVVFPEAWQAAQGIVEDDAALLITGQVENDGDRSKVLAEKVAPLASAQRQAASGLRLQLPDATDGRAFEELLDGIDEILGASPGACPVRLELRVRQLGLVTVETSMRFGVDPGPELVARLQDLLGADHVSLAFG